MSGPARRPAVWLALGGGALLVWCGRNFARSGAAEWPPLNDPAALRREASALCRGAGGWRELQPAEYPPAMTASLHPVSISVSSERVYVGLASASGGHRRFHGYYIWPDTVNRADGGIEREESDGTRSGW